MAGKSDRAERKRYYVRVNYAMTGPRKYNPFRKREIRFAVYPKLFRHQEQAWAFIEMQPTGPATEDRPRIKSWSVEVVYLNKTR